MKSDFITHGYFCISNHGGYEIELSDCGDSARLKYYDSVLDWQEIKYDYYGHPYVLDRGAKLFTNNFIKFAY